MVEKKLLHKYIVVICREGTTEAVPFGDEYTLEEIKKYFDRASQQWSDAYLCEVIEGPIKI